MSPVRSLLACRAGASAVFGLRMLSPRGEAQLTATASNW
jgi:hypothetical protein